MYSDIVKMNVELKDSFTRIKPVCDLVMICPSDESISNCLARVAELKKNVVQELQQYLLYPFITHLSSTEIKKKYELQWKLVDGMQVILEKVVVNSYEMCWKIEAALLQLVFDKTKPGMIAEVPEEVKHSVMKCLTVLMLRVNKQFRMTLLQTQVPLMAQAIFVSVHIAKLEKMRALRLAAIDSLTAHTATHAKLTNDQFRIPDENLERQVVDMLASILPGVLAALQDVVTCTNNPGHAVIVASIEAIHRVMCLTMQDSFKSMNQCANHFAETITDKINEEQPEVSCKEKNLKDFPKWSKQWYAMAGKKLNLITKSLLSLRKHEHYKVRKELAVFSFRILNECAMTMHPSVPIVLDNLISLSKDPYPEVAEYCTRAINDHFNNSPHNTRHRTLDNLSENLLLMMNCLPRELNDIDVNGKFNALNLFHGYLSVLCDAGRPQRLTVVLSVHCNMRRACAALLHAATLDTGLSLLTHHRKTDLSDPMPAKSTWCKLLHVDPGACEERLQDIFVLLATAECGDLVLDRLLQLFHQDRTPDQAYVINSMAKAPNLSQSFLQRILDAYIEEEVWYLPLEVSSGDAPVTADETLDVTVYNPRAWDKDTVPGLYEGTVETRYTDIGYSRPRVSAARAPGKCATLGEAQRNLALTCLVTEGVGVAAEALGEAYQPYLLKTLCLVLERVGSKYLLVHEAGVRTLQCLARAGGHASVAELVATNADYFTHQVTLRLKKSWNTESALQILAVVMEYSDASILDCLYGIVRDVLVQSCDKYYQKNLYAYLQVFLTFVNCINKWFPAEESTQSETGSNSKLDLTKDLLEFIKNTQEAERLMSNEEFEKETGKSVDEMYKEDLKAKEDDVLDYDDKVTEEQPAEPQHVSVTLLVVSRVTQLLGGAGRDEAALALRVLSRALPPLRHTRDLLPHVHRIWQPLAARFETDDPIVLRDALGLLVTLADISKDFIYSRCVKEVLPHLYRYLHKSAAESRLKDVGSWYRTSAAYELQASALAALASLGPDLGLRDARLHDAMAAVSPYLSNKQPKPLQALAVKFFKTLLNYDYGATWYHLRSVCDNTKVLLPPKLNTMQLEPVVGTPFAPVDKDFETTIQQIFEIV